MFFAWSMCTKFIFINIIELLDLSFRLIFLSSILDLPFKNLSIHRNRHECDDFPSLKKNEADRLQGRKAFHRRVTARTSVGVEGSTNRIENPVKRTSGAFAVKERARCRKKLVVAACRPDQAVKVLITSRRMVSMMLGPTLYIPHPDLTGHPSVALPSASIAQFADTSLSIGWVGGPSRGPREEKEWSWPTIDREWEGER